MKKHLLNFLFLGSVTLTLLCGVIQTTRACNVVADFVYKIDKMKVTFTNVSLHGRIYYWDFDNNMSGTAFPVNPSIDFPVSKTTVFKVKLIAIDTQFVDCRDTIIKDITINPCHITADFTFDIFNGWDVRFKNLAAPGLNYKWDFGNANMSTEYSPRQFYLPTGITTYTVTQIVTHPSYDYCMDTMRKLVTIYPSPCHMYADFRINDDSTNNFSGLITNNSFVIRPSRTTWTWYFGDGDSSHSINPVHIYPGPGTYYLCVKLVDSACSDIFCDSISFDSSGAMKRGTKYSIKVIGGPEMSLKTAYPTHSTMTIYPNPGNAMINIMNHTGTIGKVCVVDACGKLIYSTIGDSRDLKIDSSGFSAGIYMIMVWDDHSLLQTFRFTKN